MSPGDAAEQYLRHRSRLLAKIARLDGALAHPEMTLVGRDACARERPLAQTRERVVSRRVLEDLRERLAGELTRLDG